MSSAFCTSLDIHAQPLWYNNLRMVKNYIKEIRASRQLTQEQLAELMNTTHTTVQRHEKGKRKLTWEQIQAYAVALKCHTLDITDGPGQNLTATTEAEKELLYNYRNLHDSAKQMYLHTLKSFATGTKEAVVPAKNKDKKQG